MSGSVGVAGCSSSNINPLLAHRLSDYKIWKQDEFIIDSMTLDFFARFDDISRVKSGFKLEGLKPGHGESLNSIEIQGINVVILRAWKSITTRIGGDISKSRVCISFDGQRRSLSNG